MPLFSIIVPIYNTEKYLSRCIESILEQTFTDFELILVDDGSTDDSYSICENYAQIDKRIKVIKKNNGGVSSARNAGMKYALAEYVWFIDSDDYILPTALKELAEMIRFTSADLIVFNKKIEYSFKGNLQELLFQHHFKYFLGFEVWNKIYKLSIIKENDITFDEKEKIGEDLLFNVRYYLYLKNEIRYINKQLYIYETRLNSAMNSNTENQVALQLHLFEKIESILDESVSNACISYFFLLHLISGTVQSSRKKMSSSEFAKINFEKYRKWLLQTDDIIMDFYKNENANVLGRMRITLFIMMMKKRKYHIAGRIMGLT